MNRWVGGVLAALLLVACSSSEVLVSKPSTVPAGLDLSGNWVLTETAGANQRAARDLLVHVFLETGEAIKVTQTDAALFVSFDRSIVEEYRFGENRDISVGPISASRASGWEGGAYVIETLDEDGAKLIDSYRLKENGQYLWRNIVLLHRNQKMIDLQQTFELDIERDSDRR